MTTKQVKFLDKDSQEILGGILIDDETLICGCCGSVFDRDEWEDSGIEILKEYNYWANISNEIVEE